MNESACWVSFTVTAAGADKLLSSNHWMFDTPVHRSNAHLLDDSGLEGGFLKIAELFAKVGFKCVSVRYEGKKLNMLYAWSPDSSNGPWFPLKQGYSVLTDLVHITRASASGVLLDHGSLHWFYPASDRKNVFRQVYLENINKGFSKPEDVEHLEEVSQLLNVKERMLLVLQEPSTSGMFPKIEEVITLARKGA